MSAETMNLDSALQAGLASQEVHEQKDAEHEQSRHPLNDTAIRMALLDMAMRYVSNHQAAMGLGANSIQESLRSEMLAHTDRLKQMGELAAKQAERRHVLGR